MRREFWGADEFDDRARDLYEDGHFERARELVREGLEAHPEAVELHISLGYVHLALESYAWARGAFHTALELEPDHEEALVGMGDVLLKLGERARAFAAFERILDMGYGGDPDLMLAVARSLYREELYERAVRFYRLAGDSPDVRAELGYTLHQLGDAGEAEHHVEQALESDPDYHEARVFYANLLYGRGDGESALAHYERVPPEKMWDPLAVWRTVELLRSYRGLPADDPALAPYLEQLERLTAEASPEDRLLASVEAAQAESGSRPDTNEGQLDLFTLSSPAPEGREPEVHRVRVRDGRVYTGDWRSIVEAMRDHSADPSVTVEEFMRERAREVRELTGIDVPADDPEAFLRASARAGLLRIDR